jgi:HK97 family phage major capsid protein
MTANERLQEQITAAVERSRHIGNQIEAFKAQGVPLTDARIKPLMAAREAALNEGEKFQAKWNAAPRDGVIPNAFGRMDDEHSGRETSDLDRHTATREYRASLNHLAKSAALTKGDPIAMLPEVERNTLTVASDGAGGYTVPADSRAAILSRTVALSEIVALVTRQATVRDTLEWPRVTPNADTGAALTKGEHIYSDAFVGSMVGEQPSTTAGQNEPGFGMFVIPMKNSRAQARLSFNLVGDAGFDLLSFLESDGARNQAQLVEQQIISGTGIGAHNKGLLQYAGDGTDGTIATVDIGGSTTHTISNTNAAVGSAPKILDLIYAVPGQYRQDPSFRIVMNSDSFRKVKGLVDADNRPMLAVGGDGMLGTSLRTIDGYKVAICEWMPVGAAATDTPILCGAMSEIILGIRQELSVAVYQERFADLDQVAIFLRSRFGVGVSNNDAFRFGICTT